MICPLGDTHDAIRSRLFAGHSGVRADASRTDARTSRCRWARSRGVRPAR
jgi:hypothetical protein